MTQEVFINANQGRVMQYLVTNDRRTLESLRSHFIEGYEEFLHEKADQKFDEVLQELVAGSIIYEDHISGKVKAFCLHRGVSCSNPERPIEYLADTPLQYRHLISQKRPYLTFEWLTVAKEFQGSFSKVQPVDLALGVSLEFMREYGYGGAMGFSRQDIKTDKVTMRFGFQKHGEVERFGLTCSIMMIEPEQIVAHPIRPTAEKVAFLWANRIDHIKTSNERIAA